MRLTIFNETRSNWYIFFFFLNVTIFELWIKGNSSKLCFQISDWISVITAIDFLSISIFSLQIQERLDLYCIPTWVDWLLTSRSESEDERENELQAGKTYIHLDGWYLEGGKLPQLLVEKHQNFYWTANIFNRCDVTNTIPLT